MALSRGSGWTDSSVAPSASAGSSQSPVTPPARQRHTYATHTPQSSIGISSLASIHEDSLYVTDTDAGTLPVLMPPTYDPEWATARSPPLPGTEGAERAGPAVQIYVPTSQAYIGRSTESTHEANARPTLEPRDPRRTSGQVTQLLSELWGAPLQRNGSTWKPVRSEGSVADTPRSEAWTDASVPNSRPSMELKGLSSSSAARDPRLEVIEQKRREQRAARIRASREGNFI